MQISEGTMRVPMTVNGTERIADDVWPGESLLYVLRERLGLPGSKNACEQGECGSCTVLLDDVPVCSCLVAAGQATIDVVPFNSLLVKFAAQVGASVIIRGLRAVSDFEYEFQMVAMNQRLNTEIETVFLMADPRHQAISSKLVKEIALLGGDIAPFTTPAVAQALIKRCKEKH